MRAGSTRPRAHDGTRGLGLAAARVGLAAAAARDLGLAARAALGLALLLATAGAGAASAQDAAWVTIARTAVSGRAPLSELNGGLAAANLRPGAPLRLVLSGTLTDGIDGAELDAVGRSARGVRDALRPPLRLPAGVRVTHADEAAHRYEAEVAPGTDLRFLLDVGRLASGHLVTASEMRGRLDGAIEIALLAPRDALPAPSTAGAAPAPALGGASGSDLGPWAVGGALATLGLALVARKRTRSPEETLERRAVRAHAAIARKAIALGPGFTGTIAPAARLLETVRAGRAHLSAIDRARAETAFVEGAAAVARRAELLSRRADALTRMGRATGALEEALVTLGASSAERSAAPDVERSLRDLAAEVDVGRAVDRELGLG